MSDYNYNYHRSRGNSGSSYDGDHRDINSRMAYEEGRNSASRNKPYESSIPIDSGPQIYSPTTKEMYQSGYVPLSVREQLKNHAIPLQLIISIPFSLGVVYFTRNIFHYDFYSYLIAVGIAIGYVLISSIFKLLSALKENRLYKYYKRIDEKQKVGLPLTFWERLRE